MAQSRTLFIGMDVHKDSIAVADIAQDHGAAVTSRGAVGTHQGDIAQLLRQRQSKAQHLIVVYEAGPCGSWLSRYLTKKDYACWVVAPSLIPQKPGDRVNTDRRDALQLARLARSGALTAVYGPEVEEEARRALTRARADARSDLQDAKPRLTGFLRRHLTRFDTPRERLKLLGPIPAEYSSGERRRQGAITKAGHTYARRVLVEGAWAYRYPAKVSRPLQLRWEKPPKAIQDISWKAQGRLCTRYRTLLACGQHANQVVVAIARELVGCMGAIAKAVPVTP